MKEQVTTGDICLKDGYDFVYRIASISYTEREDESFFYEIRPNYSVISLLGPKDFQGIPGLNLDLKKEVYRRENIIPVFISERTPSKNREDLYDLLQAIGMDYLNQLEWLIRTDTRYSGDNFYVERPKEIPNLTISSFNELGNRSAVICQKILEVLCYGGEIHTPTFVINDENRKEYYDLLMALYKTEKTYLNSRRKEGIKEGAEKGNYKGRKRIKMSVPFAHQVFYDYEQKKISSKEGAKKLGISNSTFLRRYREYKKEE